MDSIFLYWLKFGKMLEEVAYDNRQARWSKVRTKIIVFTLLTLQLVESFSHHPRNNSDIERTSKYSLDNMNIQNFHKDWMYRNHDGVLFPAILNAGTLEMSSRVAFAPNMPSLPPFHGKVESMSIDDLIKGSKSLEASTENETTDKLKRHRRSKKSRRGTRKRKPRKHRHGHGRRHRRSHRHGHVRYESPISACTGVSDWRQLTHSLNQWEQRVIVLPYIEINGRTMQQYFFETNCINEESQCQGVDKRHYKSECVTKKIFTYAYVRHPTSGEESWSYIQINGSCNCKLQRKVRHGRVRNILDHLNLQNQD